MYCLPTTSLYYVLCPNSLPLLCIVFHLPPSRMYCLPTPSLYDLLSPNSLLYYILYHSMMYCVPTPPLFYDLCPNSLPLLCIFSQLPPSIIYCLPTASLYRVFSPNSFLYYDCLPIPSLLRVVSQLPPFIMYFLTTPSLFHVLSSSSNSIIKLCPNSTSITQFLLSNMYYIPTPPLYYVLSPNYLPLLWIFSQLSPSIMYFIPIPSHNMYSVPTPFLYYLLSPQFLAVEVCSPRGWVQKSSMSNQRHPNVFCGRRAPELVISTSIVISQKKRNIKSFISFK